MKLGNLSMQSVLFFYADGSEVDSSRFILDLEKDYDLGGIFLSLVLAFLEQKIRMSLVSHQENFNL